MKNDDGFFLVEIIFDCLLLVLLAGVLNYVQVTARQLELSQSSVAAQLLCQEYTDKMCIDYQTKGAALDTISTTKTLNGVEYGITSKLADDNKQQVHTEISWQLNGRQHTMKADRIVRNLYI